MPNESPTWEDTVDASAPSWEDTSPIDEQFRRDELARQTFEARIEGEQAKALSGLTDIGTEAAKAVVRAASHVDPTGFTQGLMQQYGVEHAPQIVSPEVLMPDVETVSKFAREGLGNLGIQIPEFVSKPTERVAAGLVSALPEMAPALITGAVLPKLGQPTTIPRLFQAQMYGGVPTAGYAAVTAETPEQMVEAAEQTALGLAFPAHIEGQLRRPQVIPPITGRQIEAQRGAIPPRGETVAPIERVTPEQAAVATERMSAPFEGEVPKFEETTPIEKTDVTPSVTEPAKPEVAAAITQGPGAMTRRVDPEVQKSVEDLAVQRMIKFGDEYDKQVAKAWQSMPESVRQEVRDVNAYEAEVESRFKGGLEYGRGTGSFTGSDQAKSSISRKLNKVKKLTDPYFTGFYSTTPFTFAKGEGRFGRFFQKEEINAINPSQKPTVESIPRGEEARLPDVSKESEQKALAAEQPTSGGVQEGGAISQGPGAQTAPRQTIESSESYSGTALKNAVAEVERVSYGLPEASPTQRQAMGAAWIKAARVMQENPMAGERLVSEMRNDPRRALTDEDSAVLLRHKVGLENEMNRAAELTNIAEDPAVKAENQAKYQMLSDQLLELLDMAKARGSEWGREGRWRQAIANADYSFATMESRFRASLGGRRLNESEHAQLLKDFEELKATQKAYEERLAQHESQVEELQLKLAEEKAAHAEAGEQPAIHPTILRLAEDYAKKWDERGNQALADLKALFGGGDSPMFSGAPITPAMLDKAIIYGTSKMVRGAVDFAKWSDSMIRDLGQGFEKYAKEVFAASKKAFESDVSRAFKTQTPTVKRALKQPTTAEIGEKVTTAVKDRLDKKELSAVSGYLQRLARALWNDGVRDRDQRVDAMHAILSTKIPDITRREVARMWSGYGDYRQLSKEEITVALRKEKGELLEISKLEDMAEGRPPLKSGNERGEISEARRQLIKKVNDAKYKFQIPIEDPNTQLKSALDTYKTTLENRSADLEDRLARGDFAPRARRELVLDEKAMELKAKNLRVRQRYEQALEKNRLANRKPWQKLLDNFVKWERAFKLSSPVVFGKLGAAAVTRLVTTTAEEALGAGLSKLPVISKIAKQAPREGGASIEGMSKGLAAMVTKGIQDAKQTAKSGMTDLDIILGKEGGLDREWVNLFGQLHGMMKAPIKRFEYELSLQKRIEAAMRNGEDVRDRQTMMKLMTEAMNDGYRSIFMQRGFTADLFNTALHMAETSKKYQPQGEIFARVMRFLLPIVRVPVNIVSETATGITGIPVASARTMFHIINGSLKTMDPKVADSIMRQFKKGSIGAGLMAIGFMNPENIGGYDWREKRGANAPKAGGFQIFGMNVPRWLTHAPWFELLQFGATIRHAMNNPKKGPAEGALAASVGLIEQTPFYGEAVRLTQAGESGKRFGVFSGEMLRSTIVPQAIQKLAELTDASEKKRKPQNWYQHVMYGIPGLRQYVPEERSKSKF